nr:helix-turn-helix domain-containing protein [Yersinia mollaretii]
MSLDAYNWATKIRVGNAAAKSVLKVLADRAGADHLAFPSITSIVLDTELDKKTVQKQLRYLADARFIEDSGERRGITGRVIVWRLIGVPDRTGDVKCTQKREYYQKRLKLTVDPISGDKLPNEPPANDEEIHANKGPKNGGITPEEGPKNGFIKTGETIPFLVGNDPKNGIRNRSRTDQDLKPIPPVVPQGGKTVKFDPLSIPIPEWLDVTVWHEWVEYRQQTRKPIKTALSVTKVFNLLKTCLDEGHDPTEIINTSIANGYQGLFKPKSPSRKVPLTEPPPHWNSEESWEDFI